MRKIAQEEEKKADNSIQEEEPNQAMQKQEFQYLAENLVLKLQTMNDRDEIRDLIAQVFYEVKSKILYTKIPWNFLFIVFMNKKILFKKIFPR